VEVEPRRRAVAGPVTLASGLGPHDRIDGAESGVDGRTHAESGALDVAPVAPCLADVLHTGAALVDDEVRGEAGEKGGEGLEIV
jgi:hypothetical protein